MARRRGYDKELEAQKLNPEQDQEEREDEVLDEDYEADVFDDAYDDEEYDAEYDDDGEEDEYDEEDEAPERGGFFSSVFGKVITGVIALLVVALVALLVWRFVGMREEPMEITDEPVLLPTAEPTKAPEAIVFAPVVEPTQEPTQEPTASPTPTHTPTPEPTDTPEPTATPLPIILSNTPTPSPTPTASPTPTPTPTPTPSPKPTATPRVDLAEAETNREAKLRESASSSGKVKKTLKKGEALTVHEATYDKSGKLWYFVSVNDLDTQGWMRDYVIDVNGEIDVPTPTPKPTATPKAEEAKADQPADNQTPTPAPEQTGIGTGKTNKDANVRKIMNGKVITQLRKGKQVIIHDAKLDKNGDLWYEIQVKDQTTRGFVRSYLITLDKGVEIAKPTPTPVPTEDPAVVEARVNALENLLDREVVGKAATNRSANVRQKPSSTAKVAVQLKKNTELMILGMYNEGKVIWYEVATANGETYGFVRDYVIDVSELKEGLEAQKYVEPDTAAQEDAEEEIAE